MIFWKFILDGHMQIGFIYDWPEDGKNASSVPDNKGR